jgi:ABC-type Fe3+ transport system substrate-binding protein
MFGRNILLSLPLLFGVAAPSFAAEEIKLPPIGKELVVYSGSGAPDEMASELVEPFKAYIKSKYKIDIDVRLVSGPAANVWVAMRNEWPTLTGDVYKLYPENVRTAAELGYILPLKKYYTDEEWSHYDQDAWKTMGTGDYSWPIELSASVLVVQNSVPGKITSWNDLGDRTYYRRVTFDSAVSVAAGLNMVLMAAIIEGSDWRQWFKEGGFDKEAARPAFEKVKGWADNALTLTKGGPNSRPLLARGEALIAAQWWHNGVAEIQEGFSIHIVYPKEGVPSSVQSGPVIAKTTKNLTAAVEWVKFISSVEAGKLGDRLGYVARIRRNDEPPSEAWAAFRRDAKIIWADEFRSLAQDEKYAKGFLDLYNQVVVQGK